MDIRGSSSIVSSSPASAHTGQTSEATPLESRKVSALAAIEEDHAEGLPEITHDLSIPPSDHERAQSEADEHTLSARASILGTTQTLLSAMLGVGAGVGAKLLIPIKNLGQALLSRAQRIKPSERQIRKAARKLQTIINNNPDPEGTVRVAKHLSQISKLTGASQTLKIEHRSDLPSGIRVNDKGVVSIPWQVAYDHRGELKETGRVDLSFDGNKIKISNVLPEHAITFSEEHIKKFEDMTGCSRAKTTALLTACQASYDGHRITQGENQWREINKQDTSMTGHGDQVTLHLNYGQEIGAKYKRLKNVVTVRFKDGKIDSLEPALVMTEKEGKDKNIEWMSRYQLGREIRALSRLEGQENCLPMIGYIENTAVNGFTKQRLIVPKFDGDLTQLRSAFRDTDKLSVMIQTLNGLAEVHRAGIVHNDVKPENILIRKSGDGYHAAIADFGHCRFINEEIQSIANFTKEFVAPEVLQPQRIQDHKSDVFSMGLSLFELRKGYIPSFCDITDPAERSEGAKAISDRLSEGDHLDRLIGEMLSPHSERPDLDSVITTFKESVIPRPFLLASEGIPTDMSKFDKELREKPPQE